jgi:pyoverdine/dityrosine biosynthesis protein Dit1
MNEQNPSVTIFDPLTKLKIPSSKTKIPIDRKSRESSNDDSKILDQIFSALTSFGNHDQNDYLKPEQLPILKNIKKLIAQNKPLIFILPAFPAKSSNRNKTEGPLPDLGEVIALANLNKLCSKIEDIYTPGAQVLICSDGRVFNDLVFVTENDLLAYDKKIREIIIEFQFSHLSTYNLDAYVEELGDSQLKRTTLNLQNLLLEKYGPTLESIKNQVKICEETKKLFNGIHRFIKEDLTFVNNRISKNQLNLQAKEVAYQVIQRSRAWDQLLEKKFPETLRLSIHPYPITHRKFGIKLLESENRWATPWHNIVLKHGNNYQLTKRIEALRKGANLKFRGDYSFYEI